MKVLVAVKRCVDYNVRVRAKADGTGVDVANARMSMNPFDEIAVEEAVRMKESGAASEVVVFSAGDSSCEETLRTALALGADRAILVESDCELQPLGVAKILRAICERENPQLVLCGKQAIDDDAHQTGQMLAALLRWPQATAASKIVLTGDAVCRTAAVTREVDGGAETLEVRLPAVVTTDLRLNEPRYATLPNIMKARKKPVETLSVVSLGVDATPRLKTVAVAEPSARHLGRLASSVEELVALMRSDGVLE